MMQMARSYSIILIGKLRRKTIPKDKDKDKNTGRNNKTRNSQEDLREIKRKKWKGKYPKRRKKKKIKQQCWKLTKQKHNLKAKGKAVWGGQVRRR